MSNNQIIILLILVLIFVCLSLIATLYFTKRPKEEVTNDTDIIDAVELKLLVKEPVNIDAEDNPDFKTYRYAPKYKTVYLEVGDDILREEKNKKSVLMHISSFEIDCNVLKVNLEKEDGEKGLMLYTPRHIWVKKGDEIEQLW